MKEVPTMYDALREIKATTIYTNHTLEQAAEAEFTTDQFERFVIPNLENRDVGEWLREKKMPDRESDFSFTPNWAV